MRIWTIKRATGIGVMAALASAVLWPIYSALQEAVRIPYLAALGLTAFCGISILWITLSDLLLHRRGSSLRPVRMFDAAVGIMLAAPTLLALVSLLG